MSSAGCRLGANCFNSGILSEQAKDISILCSVHKVNKVTEVTVGTQIKVRISLLSKYVV